MDSNKTKERKDTFKQIVEERRSIRNYVCVKVIPDLLAFVSSAEPPPLAFEEAQRRGEPKN